MDARTKLDYELTSLLTAEDFDRIQLLINQLIDEEIESEKACNI